MPTWMTEWIKYGLVFLAGVISTFLIEKYIEALANKFRKNRKNRKIREAAVSFAHSADVFPLELGDPYLDLEDIKINDSGKKLIVPFPAALQDQMKECYPGFEFHEGVSFDNSQSFEDLERMTRIPDLRDRIRKHSSIVALRFIEMKKSYETVFNGHKFGVYSLGARDRDGQHEKTKLRISTYRTDFFTYRVFSSIYQELKKEGHPMSKVERLEDLSGYSPFLSSFGVCTFVLLQDDSRIVFALRSNKITSRQGKYHFTMNEGLSQTDTDAGGINLATCLIRGLWEELNIPYSQSLNKKICFLDLFFTRDRFEIGITSTVSFPDLDFEDFKFKKQSAKDAFESEALISVPLTKQALKEFMATREMIPDAKLGLQLLMGRHI